MGRSVYPLGSSGDDPCTVSDMRIALLQYPTAYSFEVGHFSCRSCSLPLSVCLKRPPLSQVERYLQNTRPFPCIDRRPWRWPRLSWTFPSSLVIFTLIIYFMTGLNRSPGHYFEYLLFVYVDTLTMTAFFRFVGYSFGTFNNASKFSSPVLHRRHSE
jgi:hypothetical protein